MIWWFLGKIYNATVRNRAYSFYDKKSQSIINPIQELGGVACTNRVAKDVENLPSTATPQVELRDLTPYTRYRLCVAAGNEAPQLSEEKCYTFDTRSYDGELGSELEWMWNETSLRFGCKCRKMQVYMLDIFLKRKCMTRFENTREISRFNICIDFVWVSGQRQQPSCPDFAVPRGRHNLNAVSR